MQAAVVVLGRRPNPAAPGSQHLELAGSLLSLPGANLTRADLGGAYLFGAYLSGADLTGARVGEWTRLPAGVAVPPSPSPTN